MRRPPAFTLALALIGCTPAGQGGAARAVSTGVEAERPLNVGLMYWALPRPVGEGEDAILVIEGQVLELEVRPGEGIARQGELVHEGLVRVDEVRKDLPPRPRGQRPPLRYTGQRLIRTDALEGVAVGDRIVLFIHDYDGGYGIVPASDLGGPHVRVLP